MVTEDLTKGYSKEEEYFYKANKELIERKRRELDLERENAQKSAKTPHWMKCPKCGERMSEVELTGIRVDQCQACHGIYFDHGELEILIESKSASGFLAPLKRLFR